MKQKTLLFSALGAGVITLMGAGIASAHGPFGDGSGQGLFNRGEKAPRMEIGLESKADLFGLTKEELQAELKAGKKLPELLEEKGISPEQLHASLQADMKTKLQAVVEAGKLTQEKADALLTNIEKKQQQMQTLQPLREELHTYMQGELSTYLGIDTSNLNRGKEQHDIIEQALEAKGITESEFRTHMDGVRNAYLSGQVENGVMTQTEADQLAKGIKGGKMHIGGKAGFWGNGMFRMK